MKQLERENECDHKQKGNDLLRSFEKNQHKHHVNHVMDQHKKQYKHVHEHGLIH